jgi:hypothetical protein
MKGNSMKKLATVLLLASVSSLFAGNSTPPMPPSFGGVSEKPYPESCKSLPKMIVFLPPPMEVDFIQCKNDLNMPTVFETQQALNIKFGAGVSEIKVALAEGFHQLYRVDFKLSGTTKTIFVNGDLTKFIDGSTMNFIKQVAIPTPSVSTESINKAVKEAESK